MAEIKYTVWYSLLVSPGSRSACRLLEAYDGDTEAIYRSTEEELLQIIGINKDLVKALSDKDLNPAMQVIERCKVLEIKLLPFDDPLYPKRLRRIPDYPILLYYKGYFPPFFDEEVSIATVGTRRVTEYGERCGYLISRDMARTGAIIVSGMALGADTACHRGALDTCGHTIAVLGCGLDVVYPKQNSDLMYEIECRGTLISEYPPGTPPLGHHFPTRNRIISGLSLGTLVIEADKKSGAMITARLAREQGRDLYALPGKIGELNSLGTLELIKEGARMVTGALDILEEYDLIFPHRIHTERLYTKVTKVYVEPVRQRRSKKNKDVTPAEATAKETVTKPSSQAAEPKATEPAEEKNTEPKVKMKKKVAQILQKPYPIGLSEDESKVYDAIPDCKSISADELARQGIPVARVMVALTTLEIKRLVVCLPGGTYMKTEDL